MRYVLRLDNKRIEKSKVANFEFLILLSLGSISILLFIFEVYFSVSVSIVLMFFVVQYFRHKQKLGHIGPLILVFLCVYILPFIHILGYLFFDYNANLYKLWGLAVVPYMFDKKIIELTAMIGATGALGMALSVSVFNRQLSRDNGLNSDGLLRMYRSLNMPVWYLWVIIGVFLSWISAPEKIILSAAYATSSATHVKIGFSSAWMMSYVVLTFAFVDALVESNARYRALKRITIFFAVLFVVVWFQLLRGDRESLSWVFALCIVYFYWGRVFVKSKNSEKVNWKGLSLFVFGIVLIGMIVGGVRSNVVGLDLNSLFSVVFNGFSDGSMGILNMLNGTWSAVLLTPLSVAGDHINHTLPIKWGKDYLDILLSMPPGFVSDALGYERPLTGKTGPAWEMRYGLGGTHATVVPFMNYRMFGVFFVPAIWTYFLAHYERKSLSGLSVTNLAVLASLVFVSPHFLWYGEKYGINLVIMCIMISIFYRISLSLRKN